MESVTAPFATWVVCQQITPCDCSVTRTPATYLSNRYTTADGHIDPAICRRSGLRADGSQRLYRVDTERLAEVRAALERFWGARLGRLSAALAADREPGPAGGTP
jgi:hypothetical protein